MGRKKVSNVHSSAMYRPHGYNLTRWPHKRPSLRGMGETWKQQKTRGKIRKDTFHPASSPARLLSPAHVDHNSPRQHDKPKQEKKNKKNPINDK